VDDAYAYGYAGRKGARLTARSTTFVVVAAFHVLAVWLLLQVGSVRTALVQAAPIMVSLITPPQPKPPEVKPEVPPRPKPVRKRIEQPKPVAPPPIITAPRETESPYVAPPPPPPAPLPPVEAPVAVAAPPEAAPPAPPAPPPPAPVTPPSFNADYLNNPPPAYPALSRRMGEEGRVVLRVYVSDQGLPGDIQVRTSSGHPRLDEAATATVRQWRFVPARRGKDPVGAWVLVPISFSLRS
jgi:periplasmic protein TonB